MDWLKWIADMISRRVARSGPLVRVLLIFTLAVIVAVLVWMVPFVRNFSELFRQAGPETQSFILVVALALIVATVAYAMDRAVRVEELKDAKVQADSRREDAEKAAAQLQDRWDRLLDVECQDVLWKRGCTVAPPPFVAQLSRKTRFLTVLNLKGGVGKTTLAGNLAACLATGSEPLRVLLIDIDFQGTLSDATVDPELARLQRQNDSVVDLLLDTTPSRPALVSRLAVSMNRVERAHVILARDSLETIEFRLQARFLLNADEDPRFRFRSHLHTTEVVENYDLVIFDCPPRITTSVVNAIACSDFVLMPTKLDDGSVDAIPRTVAWLKSLGPAFQADVGIVASHTTVRDKKLVKADQQSYERLARVVESVCGDGKMFAAHVRQTNDALAPARGVVASTVAEGRTVFVPVALELRKRMSI